MIMEGEGNYVKGTGRGFSGTSMVLEIVFSDAGCSLFIEEERIDMEIDAGIYHCCWSCNYISTDFFGSDGV
jgi:hypothetical protein